MTLARECIEAMERTTVANPWAPTGSPSFAMPANDRDKLLAVLHTLAERGPSDRMHDAAYGEGSPIGHGANAVWDAMLRALIAEIEEER